MAMKPVSTNDVDGSPVFYAGRFLDRVADAGLPEGCAVLGDWDVLPARLAGAVEGATTVVVLDLFSFPYESLAASRRDVPLLLVLPPGFDAGFLVAVFGEVAFERLGFFDRVAAADAALLEDLRGRYGWAGCQLIKLRSGEPGEAARELLGLLEAELATPTFFGEDGRYEAVRYWRERGAVLAASSPHRAVCSVRHGPDFNKAMHRAQSAALMPQFEAARGARSADAPFEVLEVGCGVGRWAASFDLSKTRFTGVDISEGMVAAARANFPEGNFDVLGEDLALPYGDESFDLVFSVTVMHHNPRPAKERLLSEMWRVAKPGGRLLFLEDFVSGGWTEASTVYPMSVTRFVDLLLEATNWQLVLEHVESLKYPHDDLTRGGVLAFSRLGVPKRW